MNLWSAYSTIAFFTSTLGLEIFGVYDFYIDYVDSVGAISITSPSFVQGLLGSVSVYIDVWSSDRTLKIARVRLEETLFLSEGAFPFPSIDLGSTITDWDLISLYPCSPSNSGSSGGAPPGNYR